MILNNKQKKGEKEMKILDLKDEIININSQMFFLSRVTADIISEYESDTITMGFVLSMESIIDKLNILYEKLDKLERRENE